MEAATRLVELLICQNTNSVATSLGVNLSVQQLTFNSHFRLQFAVRDRSAMNSRIKRIPARDSSDTRVSRRSALQFGLNASCYALLGSHEWLGGAPVDSPAQYFPDCGLEPLARLKSRASKSIAGSPLSIGFETLDRQMFEPEKAYAHVAELGVKWARCQTGWARTEKTRGQFDFSWLDKVVDSLRRAGVQPWFNLGYGNRLYSPDAPDESAVGWVPLNSREATEGWLRYVEMISTHFADRVSHWEIWNEPNISNFWHPSKPEAARYVELVRLTAPIIRRNIKGAQIIGGALAGMPASYLESCLQNGLGELVDTISFHPYRPLPEAQYDTDVKAFRDLIARHKPGLSLWQGENGCPSQPDSSGALGKYAWDETKQAKWLLRRILSDLRLGMELTSYFHTVDLLNYNWGNGSTGKANTKGLLRGGDYSPKPAYFAYQSLCALFDSDTVRVESPNDNIESTPTVTANFTRRGQPLHVFWKPADLNAPFSPERMQLPVRFPKSQPAVAPVLIDPLSGQIYNLRHMEGRNGVSVASPLPLLDYPLIVTTRAAAGMNQS